LNPSPKFDGGIYENLLFNDIHFLGNEN